MLKTGTFDDTFASHYVLVNPDAPGPADENNVSLLDPIQPLASKTWPWRLSDSAKWLRSEPRIAREWRKTKIKDLQIGGVWVFGRWPKANTRLLGAPLLAEMSKMVEDRRR